MSKLTVSLSPHFQNPTTTRVLMNDVLIALGPVTLMSLLNTTFSLEVSGKTVLRCSMAEQQFRMPPAQ